LEGARERSEFLGVVRTTPRKAVRSSFGVVIISAGDI